MGERHSEHERDVDDFYVDGPECIDALVAFYGDNLSGAHDPCCGMGTIPDRLFTKHGFRATGADLIDRAAGRFPVRDFLADKNTYPSIVSNPPFRMAPKIVEHALMATYNGGLVAVIGQAKFLFSQVRHPLFVRPEMESVIIFSRRPSMPPGKLLMEKGEACRGGGSLDFAWFVWRVGKTAPGCSIDWTL